MSFLEKSAQVPGGWSLTLGVIFPVFVVLLELATGLCADAFFDPLPTFPHVMVVLAVPAINFVLWHSARQWDVENASPWLAIAGGAAIAVSAAYILLFLPILPIALIGIIVLGLGLLPFSPVFAVIVSAKLLSRLSDGWPNAWQLGMSGAVAALLALAAIDIPATATYLALGWSSGDTASQRRAAKTMRAFGDDRMLLRLCYGDDGRATGLVSVLASMWQNGVWNGGSFTDTTAARELYFRATGEPFNTAPMPGGMRGRRSLFAFDEDQGGNVVGGLAEGLSLQQSRIDASVAPADNLAYVEWTATFDNASTQQREARLTLALPAGAVASRATLWVDGEPREASVAARTAARAAYESVVKARRDPLLVTTDGADRLLVQAFPVQPGASLKLRIGMTAPFAISRNGSRSLALFNIADRNFAVAKDFAHSVWIEADEAVAASNGKLSATKLASGAVRLQGEITDTDLGRVRPRIVASRVSAPSVRIATLPAKPGQARLDIVQTIARIAPESRRTLTILLDGSAGNRAGAAGLERALGAIPAGYPVGLVVAGDETVTVAPAPWSPAQGERVRDAIEATDFEGGQDHALPQALQAVGGNAADLLWVHGPQPVAFARSRARLEQHLERDETLPQLVRYQSAPGPSFQQDDSRWFAAARVAVPSGDAAADLTGLIADLTSTAPRWAALRRARARGDGQAAGATSGSPHIVRLWGAERIASAPDTDGAGRPAAIALARRLNIITPVSGAVVLEKDVEYKANGLDVPDAADVPTVPEPATWALIIVLVALFAWMLRRRGFAFA